jgi:adenylate cyclase
LGEAPDQKYFAEGITDDVITELSRFSSLFVFCPSSTKPLQGNPECAHTVARNLGIAYIVQGNVRRSASRIRITVHLIEAASERRLWSEHFDRELEEAPAIHDGVTRTIAAAINGRAEAHRVRQLLDTVGVSVYDLILKAKALRYKISKPFNAEARVLLERAIEMDPTNARAAAWLASVHGMDGRNRWTPDPDESTRLALELGRRALVMDDSEYVCHLVYGELLHAEGEDLIAESHLERALQLNPNDIGVLSAYSSLLASTGRAKEADHYTAVAVRLGN